MQNALLSFAEFLLILTKGHVPEFPHINRNLRGRHFVDPW